MLTSMGILMALVIVLQAISTAIFNINPLVSITLALTPIVIGAILYGPKAGAILGAGLGIVVFVTVIFGWAGAISTDMFIQNPIVTCIVCILKTTLAGLVSGLAYSAIKKSGKEPLGAIVAAILCPIVNTTLFITGFVTIFHGVADKYAASSNISIFMFIITIILGINFVIEFLLNAILSPVIARIVKIIRKNKLAK